MKAREIDLKHPEKTPWISPKEAAGILGCGKTWVYDRVRTGEIPGFKWDDHVGVNLVKLLKLIEKLENDPPAA